VFGEELITRHHNYDKVRLALHVKQGLYWADMKIALYTSLHLEDRCSMVYGNVGILPQYYLTSQSTRPRLETSPPWKPQSRKIMYVRRLLVQTPIPNLIKIGRRIWEMKHADTRNVVWVGLQLLLFARGALWLHPEPWTPRRSVTGNNPLVRTFPRVFSWGQYIQCMHIIFTHFKLLLLQWEVQYSRENGLNNSSYETDLKLIVDENIWGKSQQPCMNASKSWWSQTFHYTCWKYYPDTEHTLS